MDRTERILKLISKSDKGLEIGPSHSPIAPKKDGYNAEIIDHLSKQQLIEQYTGHGVDLDVIEDVDYVWSGQSYTELTGKRDHYDWIISSHNIEHTPDIIRFLNDCSEILNDDGIISLVIPDKRYCFDRFRPLTTLADVVDSNIEQKTIHSPGKVLEYCMNVVAKNGAIGWTADTQGDYSFVHDLKTATARMTSVIEDEKYWDIHNWCFVPSSFRLLINDLNQLGLISMKEVDFFPTVGCEFYITLRKTKNAVDECLSVDQRIALMQQVEGELLLSEPAVAAPLPDVAAAPEGASNPAPEENSAVVAIPSLPSRIKNRLVRMIKS